MVKIIHERAFRPAPAVLRRRFLLVFPSFLRRQGKRQPNHIGNWDGTAESPSLVRRERKAPQWGRRRRPPLVRKSTTDGRHGQPTTANAYASIEEMAKMGIRMLSPETAQSGVALDIRNAAQNAQMGVLNTKISNTMRQIIAFMIRWKYNIEIKIDDVQFELSADFNPTPLGADWLRLATEWYEKGLIPRSVWLQILKQNDMLSPDYDDEAGKQEITADMDAVMKATNPDYAKTLEK
jgi:hypothetical protein